MPRRLIKRILPNPHEIRDHKHLRHLGARLHDPNLWHLNRNSVSRAVALGLFVSYIPIPLQMLLSAVLAVWFRVNLPIAVALVWITNPLTMPPMFYAAYKVGAWVLDLPPKEINFEISVEWLMGSLNGVWEPFLLGCLIIGSSLAVAGYFTTQFTWRFMVMRNWKRRQNNKQ